MKAARTACDSITRHSGAPCVFAAFCTAQPSRPKAAISRLADVAERRRLPLRGNPRLSKCYILARSTRFRSPGVARRDICCRREYGSITTYGPLAPLVSNRTPGRHRRARFKTCNNQSAPSQCRATNKLRVAPAQLSHDAPHAHTPCYCPTTRPVSVTS
ncbi:uncharacterized protein C8Q71DRAFT_134537 [Rhodofomes roseus]|uniref:Uncharacterized protein n=1 Tax=Rhodofomes roseus TaxID=34475 RepID=A0ABQ8KC14_9APHY|nr:uncharacterized protein C8Q71DRAFT_134537 [Rhodofomes roseus]KAH9834972.1 hypothetical protein C8Q71DRAFT_134537 [Rhodofomes roseus]